MDDRTNTIFGWVLFAGIVALGLSIVSGMYFHADNAERPEKLGYVIDVPDEVGGAADGPPLANLLAAGDAAAGEKVFAKCTACHSIASGGPNGIGPNLYGVMGEAIGQGRGFAFSSALSGHGGQWTYENMDAWLQNPRAFASGTKMSFAGLGKAEDRANVILYLRENGGGPPLPEPVAEDAAEAEGTDGAGEGPGAVEGADVGEAEAAGAMGGAQPVPSNGGGGAAQNDGGTKPGT